MVDILSQKFSKLLVIKYEGSKLIGKTKRKIYLCLCDCGNTILVSKTHLVTGNTKSCGCYKHEKPSHNNKYVGEMSGSYWGSLIASAKNRNISFDLTPKEAWEVFLNQNGKCILSNINLSFTRNKNWEDVKKICDNIKTNVRKLSKKHKLILGNASLDRINNNYGYIPDNIQWVDKSINRAKHINNNCEFVFLCHLINRKIIIVYENNYVPANCCVVDRKFLNRCKNNHRKFWYIDESYIELLLQKQNYRCPFTGISLLIGKDHASTTASLDRIDSKLGCIKDNVQFVHKRINIMKSNMNDPDFIGLCKTVSDFQYFKFGLSLPNKGDIISLISSDHFSLVPSV